MTATGVSRYLLLDANLLAGYYAPQTLNKEAAAAREPIKNIVDSVKAGRAPHLRILTPEICVAEAQVVLSKHANPQWKSPRARKSASEQSIHGRSYSTMYESLMGDLHGGRVIESVPLQRYHVLAKHLITPIDHTYHLRQGTKNYGRELGGTDQLICGVGIWLSRFLGPQRLVVMTADYRMSKVLERARSRTRKQLEDLGVIKKAEESIGFSWAEEIFPEPVYLANAAEKQLKRVLGAWPLPTRRRRGRVSTSGVTRRQTEKLVELYKAIGVARDRLPYSKELALLTQQVNDEFGMSLSEGETWALLLARLKQGRGSITNAK